MNADAFRHLYGYHFAENRALWERYVVQLTPDQFTQAVNYSHGAVRDQIVHLIGVDNIWFSELGGIDPLEPPARTSGDDRAIIRAYWDSVEQRMRVYLEALHDGMLQTRPITEPDEDKDLIVWQILLQVINHGTDHRAQLLRICNDFGIETASQDYIFYVYEHAFPDAQT